MRIEGETMAKKHMDQRLRWMKEHVDGAYNAVHPPSHKHAGKHCVNSGTCILVFCYMEALGKVLKKGSGSCSSRFHEFLNSCMPDLVAESKGIGMANPGKLLYGEFRSGFVHGYPKSQYAWARSGPAGKYWFNDKKGRLVLNIDELVAGFKRGLNQFKYCAAADSDLQDNFIGHITK